MSSAWLIKTIEDMERLYYSKLGATFISKADAPVLTTTTGVYNAVYGAMVWAQLNREANAFGALPKYPWLRSGWRVITTRPAHTSYAVGEAGALQSTVKPTFAEVSTKPKVIATNFDVSETQDYLSKESMDDTFGSLEQLRPVMGADHREAINEMLLKDFDTLPTTWSSTGTDTTAEGFESIDRITATNSEQSGVGATAADEDIYGIDRSANSWADAYSNHNSGTDRAITEELIRTILQNLRNNGGNTTFGLTGHDTYSKIQGLFETYTRYAPLGQAKAQFGVNGIQTAAGIEVGIHIPSVYNVPMIVSKNVEKDTISRVYFLDTSDPEGFGIPRLGIRISKPTQYFESGMNTGNPFAINKIANEGMYRTSGEIICTFFKAQGKLRDLL